LRKTLYPFSCSFLSSLSMQYAMMLTIEEINE
jgi:hypothetical protein